MIDRSNLALTSDTSGITYIPDTKSLFTIHNGDQTITEIDREGTIIRTLSCSGGACADFEGIEWLSSSADGSGLYTHSFMISQEGNSELLEVEIGPGDTSYTPGTSYDLGLGNLANLGIEGVAYDPDNDLYYVVREKTPVALYQVDLNGAPDVTSICDGQLGGISDLSDVDYSDGALYLLSHESDSVTKVTLDPCTVTATTLTLNMVQAEGIAWDDKGQELFIVSEPDTFSRYTVSGLNYTGTITPALDDATYEFTAITTAPDGSTAESTVKTYVVDTTRPTPVITTDEDDPTENTSFEISIDFGEDVSDFVIGDITVTNGTASDFAGGNQTYTVTITPDAAGEVTINIAENVAEDGVGLLNLAATEFSITYSIPSSGSNSGSSRSSSGRRSTQTTGVSSSPAPATPVTVQPTSTVQFNPVQFIQSLESLGIVISDALKEILLSFQQGTPSVDSATPEDSTCAVFVGNYKNGDNGSEVRNIQLFLNKELGLTLPGTNFFGPQTEAATKQFQEKYRSEILDPVGITNATGWWYPSTIAKANQLQSCN